MADAKPTLNKHNAVILTAIRSEYLAVKHHLIDVMEVEHPRGTVYERGKLLCDDGSSWTVALVEVGAGSSAATLETERAISFFNPSVLRQTDDNVCSLARARFTFSKMSVALAVHTNGLGSEL